MKKVSETENKIKFLVVSILLYYILNFIFINCSTDNYYYVKTDRIVHTVLRRICQNGSSTIRWFAACSVARLRSGSRNSFGRGDKPCSPIESWGWSPNRGWSPSLKARSAWELRAKPELREKPEKKRGLGRGLGEPLPRNLKKLNLKPFIMVHIWGKHLK